MLYDIHHAEQEARWIMDCLAAHDLTDDDLPDCEIKTIVDKESTTYWFLVHRGHVLGERCQRLDNGRLVTEAKIG